MNRRERLTPSKGFSHFIHILLVSILPVLVYILVTLPLVPLAYSIILLSKWRMLAVRPRHWPANIRANSVDIIIGLSTVSFMAQAPSQAWRLVWAISYAVWLLVIKPRSSVFGTSVQAVLGQVLGMATVYLLWGHSSLMALVITTWGVCYLSARHFLGSFDEPYSSLIAHTWGYFGAALAWVLGHWLLYYSFLAQPMLLLSVIGIGLAALYYLENNDRLSKFIRREIVLIMGAVLIVVIMFSSWGDRAV